MTTIVSYPDRGQYGNNRYRGNCSGRLILDLIEQYNIRQLSDFMVGGGTTEDVCREKGIPGTFTDLSRGFDIFSCDIPDRAENIFSHPAYWDIVRYGQGPNPQYSPKEVMEKYGIDCAVADMSKPQSWEDFIKMLNYSIMKQYEALEKGGRLFVLMGDIKKQGKLYSMLCDCVKPNLEQIIIKAQHNCWSDSQTYSNRNFVPIVHEYLAVLKKDSGLIVPVSYGIRRQFDYRNYPCSSWRDLIHDILDFHRKEMTLDELYAEVQNSPKTRDNQHWKEKIRQTVQNERYFKRTARGSYALA